MASCQMQKVREAMGVSKLLVYDPHHCWLACVCFRASTGRSFDLSAVTVGEACRFLGSPARQHLKMQHATRTR